MRWQLSTAVIAVLAIALIYVTVLGGQDEGRGAAVAARRVETVVKEKIVVKEVPVPAGLAGSTLAITKAKETGFAKHFDDIVAEELGPRLFAAMYHKGMFAAAVKTESYLWGVPFSKGFDGPQIRNAIQGLHTPGHQLVFMKRSTAMAIARMRRDAALKELFDAIDNDRALALYRSAVRRFVNGLARHVITMAQGVIDSLSDADRRGLREMAQKRGTGSPDPIHAILAAIDVFTTPEEVNKWVTQPSLVNLRVSEWPEHRTEHVMRMAYHNDIFHAQPPSTQKFFSMFRATIGCHSLQRECEAPDGCRFICNLEYLQNQLQDGKPFANRFIGVGSNNDFQWEMSMVDLFSERTSKNGIHSMTTFDCTLKNGFTPPSDLVSKPVGWASADVCIGEKTSGKYMSFLDLKEAILSSEKANTAIKVRPDLEGTRNIKRNAMNSGEAGVPGFAFDAVSIFKTDIEGWEFALIPSWAKADYAALRSKESVQRKLESEDDTIDFVKEVEFFSVSQFLLEYHATGHGYNNVWHMAHMLFQLTQMGFALAATEKNFYGDCCYETVYVHYRYFIRSEMWAGGEFPKAA